MKIILTTVITIALQLLFYLNSHAQDKPQISIGQAMEVLIKSSRTIDIAQKGINIAEAEKSKLNSSWYP